MKRDMDLVRKLLMALEEQEQLTGQNPTIDGYDGAQTGYHAYLIVQAGLANGADVTTRRSTMPEWIVTVLTWKGHEFLDLARNETTWNKVKVGLKTKAGTIGFEAVKAALSQVAKITAQQIAISIAGTLP